MNVLITGAGGFVGHHLLEYLLLKTKWNFVVVESFKHGGTSSRLSHVLDTYPDQANRIKIITHDLSTPIDNVTASKIGDVDIIINVASGASVDESILNPVSFINNNVNLQLNILEYSRTLKSLKLFVHVSTDEVYGSAQKNQIHTELHRLAPSNPYSASKAAQESICNAYWKTYNVPIIITNTMNMFGERQSTKAFIPKAISYILNNKSVPVYSQMVDGDLFVYSRFYLYVKNNADAIKFLIEKHISDNLFKTENSDIVLKFNIKDGEEIQNDNLVKKISSIMEIEKDNLYKYVDGISVRPGHDTRYSLSAQKLFSLGWLPPYSFDESLKQTILWSLENKEWLTI